MHEKIKDAFAKELGEAMKAQPSAGHAVTADGAQRAHDLIDAALCEGAEILIGGNTLTGLSALEPSILTNVNPKSRISREEGFGPSASLYTISSDEEAIEVANQTDYGLSASIFTRDYARGLRMARDLDFGQVQINAFTMYVNSSAPVTGYKGSGWGSNGGGYGVEEFMFNKHVALVS